MNNERRLSLWRRLDEVIRKSGMTIYEITQRTEDLSKGTIPNLLREPGKLPRLDTFVELLEGLRMTAGEFFEERSRDTLCHWEQKGLELLALLTDEERESIFTVIRFMTRERREELQ